MAGRGVVFFFEAGRGGCCFFPRRDGAFFFFSEAGRGGFFFFPRRDKVAFFFFDGTGRGGVFFSSSRAATGRLFLAVAIFLAGRGKIVTPSRQRWFKPSRQPSMYNNKLMMSKSNPWSKGRQTPTGRKIKCTTYSVEKGNGSLVHNTWKKTTLPP